MPRHTCDGTPPVFAPAVPAGTSTAPTDAWYEEKDALLVHARRASSARSVAGVPATEEPLSGTAHEPVDHKFAGGTYVPDMAPPEEYRHTYIGEPPAVRPATTAVYA